MSTKKIIITDPSLRDGSHACSHQITEEQLLAYAKSADETGIDYIEVGHGNGLGASSLQLGENLIEEKRMLQLARSVIHKSKLSVHVMPGFATIEREIRQAMDIGVDLFRVASHCTEADITMRHINYIRAQGKEVWGILMMTHLATKEVLLEEAQKMQSYGAKAIVLMDSAGAFLPADVESKIGHLSQHLVVPVGFHAHNNMGLSVANSLTAINAGASIVDATACGFGAGAGNTPIELLAAAMFQLKLDSNLDLYKVLETSDLARILFAKNLPFSNSTTVVSGITGIFSGFAKIVERVSKELKVDPKDVFFELGRRKVIGGQEDLILEVASELSKKNN
ncbi:4-hydroxy-2-oxovalerate aldolase [Flavipsychrobacter stenotrophus]|uniref:4-hydroxy-2-oxovalerate aldolase n=1 Tax=Flavipsychrobacter stenotrophus TaxID=2077091 RepID=A0A2S7SRV2_9BACT|nr:4-hydroxy-2-oxovalerate aldolase [Flavipsychrobacter stenotrophus]PQJ09474.1 4-hydroxy-2-oxovalerate aldolase [Flavipsychrobacter stenotrophus]